jgi:hypothetical protein
MPTSTRPTSPLTIVLGFAIALVVGQACHDDGADGNENTGEVCVTADACYPDLDDPDSLRGAAYCLDRVEGGYCTHACETDADCCAVPGECETDLPQVCGPFESTGLRLCFLSCEGADLDGLDGETYCHDYAHPAFGCRSTGGGADNRKVCVP